MITTLTIIVNEIITLNFSNFRQEPNTAQVGFLTVQVKPASSIL